MAFFGLCRLSYLRLSLIVKHSSFSTIISSAENTNALPSVTTFADIPGEKLSIQSFKRQAPLRCLFSDPQEHLDEHESLIYRVPKEHYERLVQHYLTKDGRFFVRTLDDTSLLIRKPALNILHLLRKTAKKQTLTIPRFVLWGKRGNGLSSQLAHCAHWALQSGWFVAHVPEPQIWWRVTPDMAVSSHNEERIDLPAHGATWLQLFRNMNLPLLTSDSSHVPCLSKSVRWNLKESHPVGTSLLEVLDFGIQRPKYSCDVVGILLRELTCVESLAPPLLLTVDGVNGLWVEKTRYLNDKKQAEQLDKISLVHHFRKIIRGTWKAGGGAVLCTVSSKAADTDELKLQTAPHKLLTSRGFHALDPFVPVEVPLLSRREAMNLLDWWNECGWLPSEAASSPAGREELFFLSGQNIKELHLIAGEW